MHVLSLWQVFYQKLLVPARRDGDTRTAPDHGGSDTNPSWRTRQAPMSAMASSVKFRKSVAVALDDAINESLGALVCRSMVIHL